MVWPRVQVLAVLRRGIFAPDVPVATLAAGSSPVTSAVKDTRDDVTVCVLPAKCAIPTPGEEETTQVAHPMVPVVVIGPPVIGEVVAIEDTVAAALPLSTKVRPSVFTFIPCPEVSVPEVTPKVPLATEGKVTPPVTAGRVTVYKLGALVLREKELLCGRMLNTPPPLSLKL